MELPWLDALSMAVSCCHSLRLHPFCPSFASFDVEWYIGGEKAAVVYARLPQPTYQVWP